jgi:hypothetical protein
MKPASPSSWTDSLWSWCKSHRDFRLIPRIETYPGVVAFAQTALGKLVLLGMFGSGFWFANDHGLPRWCLIMGTFTLTTFLPRHRRLILSIGISLLLFRQLFRHGDIFRGGIVLTPLAMNLSVIAVGMTLFWCARRWPQSIFGRRPIIFWLSGVTMFIVCIALMKPTGRAGFFLWFAVSAVVGYMWFIAYALADRNAKPVADFTLEFAALNPIWGSTNTPYPKGASYLRRIEAKESVQLAITQLKGLKLLAWAILLWLVQTEWNRFFHGYLGIPSPGEAMAMWARGTPPALHLRWASHILIFYEIILRFSVYGHSIIACCRFAGFNALRNTYRPLSSVTLIEFFNRIYYYFKELLVEFFYYPAFFRYWKSRRRLRIVFATFAAVFFGNSFYHVIRDWYYFRDMGLVKGVLSDQCLFFYNAVLAAALSISQLRRRRTRPSGFLRGQFVPSCGVAVFYILSMVFVDESRTYSLAQTFKYFLSLFNIHW